MAEMINFKLFVQNNMPENMKQYFQKYNLFEKPLKFRPYKQSKDIVNCSLHIIDACEEISDFENYIDSNIGENEYAVVIYVKEFKYHYDGIKATTIDYKNIYNDKFSFYVNKNSNIEVIISMYSTATFYNNYIVCENEIDNDLIVQ